MFKICKLQYEDATRFDKIQYTFTNIFVWEIFRKITYFLSRSAFVQVLKEHLQKWTIVISLLLGAIVLIGMKYEL